jgi:hypothetical protein
MVQADKQSLPVHRSNLARPREFASHSRTLSRPLVMAHRGGPLPGEENSITRVLRSVSLRYNLIELDIRRSSDGILYCHHGNALSIVMPYFESRFTFAELKERFPWILPITTLVCRIPREISIFLDIKDLTISRTDLVSLAGTLSMHSVFLASRSIRFLSHIDNLPQNWKKVLNVGTVCPRRLLRPAIEARLSILEVFWWDYTYRNRRLFGAYDIELALSKFFVGPRRYVATCVKFKSPWVVIDY